MKSIFIINTCNTHHNYNSMDIIAICDNKNRILGLIKQFINSKGYKKLSPDDLMNIETINQTQGYSEGFEFHIEEYTLNELI